MLQNFYNFEENNKNKNLISTKKIKLNYNKKNNGNTNIYKRKSQNNKNKNNSNLTNHLNNINEFDKLLKNKIEIITQLKKKGYLITYLLNKKRPIYLYKKYLLSYIKKDIILTIKHFIVKYKKIKNENLKIQSQNDKITLCIEDFQDINLKRKTIKNSMNNDLLTPIPTKRNKTKKDEYEFAQASRASYVIRRIEYSNYLSRGNKKYTKLTSFKLNKNAIIIQKWWRKMMKNNTFLYKIIVIQSYFKGYFYRRIFSLSYQIKKIFEPGIEIIMFLYYKIKFEKFLNKLICNYAFLYQFKCITKVVNKLTKNFKLYKKRNKKYLNLKNKCLINNKYLEDTSIIYQKRILEKNLNVLNKKINIDFKYGFIIIKYIIYKHIDFRFNDFKNCFHNIIFSQTKSIFINNNKKKDKLNSILKRLLNRNQQLLKIKFTQFKYISKVMKYFIITQTKNELYEELFEHNKKENIIKKLILKKEKKLKIKLHLKFIKWKKINKIQSLKPIERLYLILYKILSKNKKKNNL